MSVRPQVASTSSVFLRKLSVRISVFDIIVTRCQNRITVGVSGVRKSETWFDLWLDHCHHPHRSRCCFHLRWYRNHHRRPHHPPAQMLEEKLKWASSLLSRPEDQKLSPWVLISFLVNDKPGCMPISLVASSVCYTRLPLPPLKVHFICETLHVGVRPCYSIGIFNVASILKSLYGILPFSNAFFICWNWL